ncbi:carboxylating nicotinate-nucleotide diphosphorylase [bacterium]|nr:carboxylating nicotinate-nucleotide diphosphorylase [bacterium]
MNNKPRSLKTATAGEWLVRHVSEALREDLQDRGDITTLATIPVLQEGKAELVVKQDGIIAGIDWAVETGHQTNPEVDWEFSVKDGDEVSRGQVIATIEGPLHGILVSERTALNGLGHLSGIATMTQQAMKLIEGTRAQILETRKTMPGWRLAQKYAVLCGGGANHRIGLYDEILIKENHIRGAGGISKALHASERWMRNEGIQVPVEIEVTSLKELEEALGASPDRILLDNFPPSVLRQAVEFTDGRCLLEASGGITLESLREVAKTGVDRISLGALTHSVKPLDLSLQVCEA